VWGVRSDPTTEQRKEYSLEVRQYLAPRTDSRSQGTWGAPRDPSLERLSMANSSAHKRARVSARLCSRPGLALCTSVAWKKLMDGDSPSRLVTSPRGAAARSRRACWGAPASSGLNLGRAFGGSVMLRKQTPLGQIDVAH